MKFLIFKIPDKTKIFINQNEKSYHAERHIAVSDNTRIFINKNEALNFTKKELETLNQKEIPKKMIQGMAETELKELIKNLQATNENIKIKKIGAITEANAERKLKTSDGKIQTIQLKAYFEVVFENESGKEEKYYYTATKNGDLYWKDEKENQYKPANAIKLKQAIIQPTQNPATTKNRNNSTNQAYEKAPTVTGFQKKGMEFLKTLTEEEKKEINLNEKTMNNAGGKRNLGLTGIVEIQKFLNEKQKQENKNIVGPMKPLLAEDGLFGPKTKAEFQAWRQKKHGIKIEVSQPTIENIETRLNKLAKSKEIRPIDFIQPQEIKTEELPTQKKEQEEIKKTTKEDLKTLEKKQSQEEQIKNVERKLHYWNKKAENANTMQAFIANGQIDRAIKQESEELGKNHEWNRLKKDYLELREFLINEKPMEKLKEFQALMNAYPEKGKKYLKKSANTKQEIIDTINEFINEELKEPMIAYTREENEKSKQKTEKLKIIYKEIKNLKNEERDLESLKKNIENYKNKKRRKISQFFNEASRKKI